MEKAIQFLGCGSKFLFTSFSLFINLIITSYSQNNKHSSVLNGGIFTLEKSNDVVPYPFIRDADILWQTEIWRTIDLREKANFHLYYPLESVDNRKSLFDALVENLQSGKLIAFDEMHDDFRNELDLYQFLSIINKVVQLEVENPNSPGNYLSITDTVKIVSKDVIEYLIKEVWIFDKQRSVLEVRILGICPVVRTYDDEGSERGKRKLFWLYYPNCRSILNAQRTLISHNISAMPSFEEVFAKRMFSSYITKQSNVYDRQIADYESGIDALLEGDKIKDNIFIFEHDLWQY